MSGTKNLPPKPALHRVALACTLIFFPGFVAAQSESTQRIEITGSNIK
jgi:hypothetical protein